MKKYAKGDIKCCYQIITRRKGVPIDDNFDRGKEVCFKGSTLLSNTTQMVTVTCIKNLKTMRLRNTPTLYENLFYMIQLTESVKKKMQIQDKKRHQNDKQSQIENKIADMDDKSQKNDVENQSLIVNRVERSLDEEHMVENQREFPRIQRKSKENVEAIQSKPIVEICVENEQTTQFVDGNNMNNDNNINKQTVKNTDKTDLDLSYHYQSNIKEKLLDISETMNNISRNVTYEIHKTYPDSFQEDTYSISVEKNDLIRRDVDSIHDKEDRRSYNEVKDTSTHKSDIVETNKNYLNKESKVKLDEDTVEALDGKKLDFKHNIERNVHAYNNEEDIKSVDKLKKRDKRSFEESNKSKILKEFSKIDEKSKEVQNDEDNNNNEESSNIKENKHKIGQKRILRTVEEFKDEVVKETSEEESPEIQEEDLSLLIIGIDSISRLNMIRTMPKTRKFLAEKEWFELEGYNKVGENTFPNLIPLLTGRSAEELFELCFPDYSKSYFDPCPFIWRDLNRKGYITSYAEDIYDVSTFNYHKKGFREPPTDYYLRPLFAAGETKFKTSNMDTFKNWCVGSNSESEVILSYTREFISHFSSYSYFKFIWMNAFSHNDLNSPSRMDDKIAAFLASLNYTALENTAIVFLSDHGMRFGEIRQTYSGWFEERLPFIFFYLPEWYQKKYPRKISNLRTNKNRLTNPYDVYHTLNDLTRLTNRSTCGNCRSLLEPISENRSCSDIGISQHWCTCTEMINLSKDDSRGTAVANFVIESLHSMFEKHKTSVLPNYHCANLTLHNVHSLQTNKLQTDNTDLNMFLIRLETCQEMHV
ncbi:hypothetical protein WDU94_005846 [Cyamophila willieti]